MVQISLQWLEMDHGMVQIALESIWKRSKWIMELSKFHWNQLVRVLNGTSTGPNFLGINLEPFKMDHGIVQISLESTR